jgi:hypothetical protein
MKLLSLRYWVFFKMFCTQELIFPDLAIVYLTARYLNLIVSDKHNQAINWIQNID